MAQQRRMVYGSLFANAELNMLPIEARYLYVGTMVLADDDGRLRADPRSLRGQIFSYDESITSTDVESWLQKLSEAGQIELYERDGVKVLRHPKWKEYQKIRQDLYVPSRLPPPLRSRNDDVTEPLLKEDKLSKEKKEKYPREWLTAVPDTDLLELVAKYDASGPQIRRKAEQFHNYCVSKDKRYSNHRAALENALDRDFGRRPPKKEEPSLEKKPLTPEQRTALESISQSMRVKP